MEILGRLHLGLTLKDNELNLPLFVLDSQIILLDLLPSYLYIKSHFEEGHNREF